MSLSGPAGIGRPDVRLVARHRILLALLGLTLGGCGEDHVLTVGDVGFRQGDLTGLSERQLDQLVLITSVGIAVVRDEPERLGAVVLDRWRNEGRVELLREELALEAAGIGEDSLRVLYEDAPESELVVRHLVILSERWRSDEHRTEAESRAGEALERARAGEAFGEVAGEFSEEPGAAQRGGLLEPGREGTWVGGFWEAASRLEEGEMSEVVETEYGFHVLLLEERRTVPFDEARSRLVSRVASDLRASDRWEERQEEWEREGRTPVDVADEREIALPDPEEARIAREWETRLVGWATALGFDGSSSDRELAEQALRGLGRMEQSAQIARAELEERASELRSAYPVTHGP